MGTAHGNSTFVHSRVYTKLRPSITRNFVLLTLCFSLAHGMAQPPVDRQPTRRRGPLRARNWCFTFNNPPASWNPRACYDSGLCKFFAGQYEVGEGTGTRHFQGYVVFGHGVTLNSAKERLGSNTIHLEVRRGSHEEALSYCTKPETRCPDTDRWELGNPPASGQGSRTDIGRAVDIITAGGTIREVAEQEPVVFTKYHRGLQALAAILTPPRTEAPTCFYFWGPSEVGKSRAGWSFTDDLSRCYPVPLSAGPSVWFDHYIPGYHRAVIFDDYYHNFKFSFLLQLLDRYPIYVPYKGGFLPFTCPTIIITSNIGLHDQYPNIPDALALWRRFRRVVRCLDNRWLLCTSNNPLGIIQ